MKRKMITQADFEWTKLTPAKIREIPEQIFSEKQKKYQEIKKIKAEERTFENTVFAIESAGYGIEDRISKVAVLMEVSPKEEVRVAALQAIQAYEAKAVDFEHDIEIYQALVEYKTNTYKKEKKTLFPHEIKLFEDISLQYKKAGFELSKPDQKIYKKISKKIAKLESDFSFNINAYKKYIVCTKDELDGLPSRFIDGLTKDGTSAYRVHTDSAEYMPFMKLSHDSKKRKELFVLYNQKGGKKNETLLQQATIERHKRATLLGFKNHIAYATSDRIAKNDVRAVSFIKGLLPEVQKNAKSEFLELQNLQRQELSPKAILTPSDISYYSNKLFKERFSVDSEYIKEFFQLDIVFGEMLKLYENLFHISFIERKDILVWSKDVRILEIKDKKSKETIGFICADLFPRTGKYGHAMVTEVSSAYQVGFRTGNYNTPVTLLVCNFQTPTKTVPSLLSIGDIETLFHEFGHALHRSLTTEVFASQSGTSVAWDFVEAPSQMLENFVMEKDMLKKMSKHYKTGKSLDNKTIEKLQSGHYFMKSSHIQRQIMLCVFDFEIHSGTNTKNVTEIYNTLYKKITGIEQPKGTYFPAGFGHMVGAYAAGYYSYLWALVYADDIYSEFKKNNKKIKEVGLKYRKEILARGSGRDELISMEQFLGRKPNNKAFIEKIRKS
jgi:thimet oligopeptidase